MSLFRFPHSWPAMMNRAPEILPIVPELDDRDRALEDYLDGSAWTPYTPSWTGSIGDGELEGWYQVDKKVLDFRISLTMGASTTYGAGEWSFGLPDGFTLAAGGYQTGVVFGRDTGTAYRTGVLFMGGGGTGFVVVSHGDGNAWQATIPHTWAATDLIAINGRVEIQ